MAARKLTALAPPSRKTVGLNLNWGGLEGGAPPPAPLPPNRTVAPAPPPVDIGRRPIDAPVFGRFGRGGAHVVAPAPAILPKQAPAPAPGLAPAPGPAIPIDAPAPPTIGIGQGLSLANDPGYVGATAASAAAGNSTAQANHAVLTLAMRLRTQAVYVARYVGQDAANAILSGAHLAN